MKWILATVAPWALGVGLLVSFTATAGHDLQSGISATAALLPTAPLVDTATLMPPSAALARVTFAAPLRSGALVREARLRFDLPGEAEAEPEHIDTPPRVEMKAAAKGFPMVDRSRKGDPLVSLRPSLSHRASELRQGAGTSASRLLFRKSERALPSTVLMPGPVQAPEGENSFEPWSADEATTTRLASAARSPAAAASGSTGAGRGGTTPASDGATRTVPRAVALSSTTPAPVDAMPVEIAAAPVSVPSTLDKSARAASPDMTTATRVDPSVDRPNYADLVSPDTQAREQHCLAQAVYFEARSEPEEGQAAVAQVVLNRAKSGLYPPSICGVVFQNRHRYLACQFTFTCEGKSLRITDRESWATASRVAAEVLQGKTYLAEVGGSTHYHADYVHPRWARRLKKMDVIGRHIFYKLKPGQT